MLNLQELSQLFYNLYINLEEMSQGLSGPTFLPLVGSQ